MLFTHWLSAACFLPTDWWKFLQLHYSLALFYLAIFLLRGIHFLICYLLLQWMLNVAPYQTKIFVSAPAYGKDAQTWRYRSTGHVIVTCILGSPRGLYLSCPWFIFICSCLTYQFKRALYNLIYKFFSSSINWLLTLSFSIGKL